MASHGAHVLEEIWGRFWLFNTMGLVFFLSINLILFLMALLVLYLLILEKKIGYLLSLVYASIMILNGIAHNLAVIITGKYFGGYAGSFSGIALVVLGMLLAWHIKRYTF